MHRCFSSISKAPWTFKNTSPPKNLKDLHPEEKFNIENQLSEGFNFAFKALIEALSTHNKSVLSKCLEGRLYQSVCSRLDTLENSGYKFKLLETKNFDLKIYNFSTHQGIDIERSQNKAKEDYIIANLEESKPISFFDVIKKWIVKLGFKLNDELLNRDMSSDWIYVNPLAPANLVYSIDAVFYGQNPLTLIHDNKDIVYNGNRENEFHVLKFESCVISQGTQGEEGEGFERLVEPIKQMRLETFKQPWVVTDIDNIMGGNPYVLSKK